MRRKSRHWMTHQLRRALFDFAQAPEADLTPDKPSTETKQAPPHVDMIDDGAVGVVEGSWENASPADDKKSGR